MSASRSSNLVHLGNAVEESIAVIALHIHVEVGAARKKCELCFATEAFQCRLQAMGGSVEIKRVIGADKEMNLALEVGTDGPRSPSSQESARSFRLTLKMVDIHTGWYVRWSPEEATVS